MKPARLLLAVSIAALAGAATASAATIEVTTTKDEFGGGGSPKCGLREAIQAANTDAKFGGCTKGKGADRIVLRRGIHRLTRTGSEDDNVSGDLDVTSRITIAGKGPKATVIDGNGGKLGESIFEIASGRSKFTGMTIRNGLDLDDGYGGAISADDAGSLILDRMRFARNTSTHYGGAVYFDNDNGASLTVTRTQFLENETGGYSGGLSVEDAGDVTVRNSSFSVNGADQGYGAGMGVYSPDGEVQITRTKFKGNVADTDYGGGLYIYGAQKTALSKLAVMNNTSGAYESGYGGGIYIQDTPTVLRDSTVARNVSHNAGGGVYFVSSTLKMVNSTLSHNHASGDSGYGGGIYVDGADAEIKSSTIVFNRGYYGAGLYDNGGGTTTYENSIIARNRYLFDGSTADCYMSGGMSLGHNFFGDDTCNSTGPGDIAKGTTTSSADPRLDELAGNGGPTPTHALLQGSPAINKGKGCPKRDQRGHKRKGKCDIGAFER